MGKVRFGLEKAHYALETGEGWATPKPLRGAVSLTIEPEGETNTFFADDTSYAVFSTNAGYSGELEIASLEDDAAVDLLGASKDSKDGVYEDTDAQPKKFALLFMIKGNEKDQKFAFYECTVSRPSMSANTTTDSTDPDTVTLPFKAAPHEMLLGASGSEVTKKVVKYSMELSTKNASEYAAWFTAVQKPSLASA